VNELVDEMLSSRNELINLKDVRQQDEYLFAHSVNVCALSIMLASRMGYNKDKVKSIAWGPFCMTLERLLFHPPCFRRNPISALKNFGDSKTHPLWL
jgi:hypothetical protein